MKLLLSLVLGSVCLLPLAANAQWQWIDKNGKKVFSDQAPPIDIPDKNILRRSGTPPPPRNTLGGAEGEAAPTGDAAAKPHDTAAAAPKPSGVDKELEEKTKKTEADEKAKKAAEDAKVAKAKADNCALARQGKATVDSGIRIAKVNTQGEREIMDDAGRAAEAKRLDALIKSDCK